MSEEEVRQYFMMLKELLRLSKAWFETSSNTDEYWGVVVKQADNYIATCDRYGKGDFAKSLCVSVIDEIRRRQKDEQS